MLPGRISHMSARFWEAPVSQWKGRLSSVSLSRMILSIGHELREDEHLVAFVVELVEELHEGVELGAFLVVGTGLHERRVAADLPQAGDGLEDGEAALVQHLRTGGGEDHVLGLGELARGRVFPEPGQLAEHVLLCARRQFTRDLVRSVRRRMKGRSTGAEALRGAVVLAAVEVFLEVSARSPRAPGWRR